MAANDAFTAGVRPGGLTSSTEIRLLLCYLVKNAGPIRRASSASFILETASAILIFVGKSMFITSPQV